MLVRFLLPGLVLFCLIAAGPALRSTQAALVLNPTFDDSGDRAWDSETQGVVSQAINDWTSVIGGVVGQGGDVETVAVDFNVEFVDAGTNNFLGQWDGSFSASTGASIRPWSNEMSHTIRFNSSFMDESLDNQLWFDPTPGDDGSDKAFSDWDAVSVARHEIGHMLGFSELYRDDFNTAEETRVFPSFVDENDVFDPDGLSVKMVTGDVAHIEDQSFLMSTTLSNADGRVGISMTELQMLSTAYDVQVVPEPSALLVLCGVTLGWAYRRRPRAGGI